jgi:phosphoenolpyruvate synthase/pyruvate phosphate dikinase
MKKTFKMSHPKIKVPRLVEAIKHEVNKYLKRERRKPLPPNVDFWDFDCRYGVDEANSDVIHVSAISKSISEAEEKQLESFYLEILAKPGHRSKRPRGEQATDGAETTAQSKEEIN